MCLEHVEQKHRWVENVINTALTPSFTCSYHLCDEDHKASKVELPLSPWKNILVAWNYIHTDFYLCGNHAPHSSLPTNQLHNLTAAALPLLFYMSRFSMLLSTFVPLTISNPSMFLISMIKIYFNCSFYFLVFTFKSSSQHVSTLKAYFYLCV